MVFCVFLLEKGWSKDCSIVVIQSYHTRILSLCRGMSLLYVGSLLLRMMILIMFCFKSSSCITPKLGLSFGYSETWSHIYVTCWVLLQFNPVAGLCNIEVYQPNRIRFRAELRFHRARENCDTIFCDPERNTLRRLSNARLLMFITIVLCFAAFLGCVLCIYIRTWINHNIIWFRMCVFWEFCCCLDSPWW